MPKTTGRGTSAYTGADIALGPLTISAAVLMALPLEDFATTGVILVNERLKVRLPHGDIPVGYSLQLYITRDPLTEAETDAMHAKAADAKGKKIERERTDMDRLAREKQAAFDMGQGAVMTSLKNIGVLAQSVRALGKLGDTA